MPRKMSRKDTGIPSCSRALATTLPARIERPPRAKKFRVRFDLGVHQDRPRDINHSYYKLIARIVASHVSLHVGYLGEVAMPIVDRQMADKY
jgi:hypothetical protein